MLSSPLCHIGSGLLPSCNNLDVDQEPAGPQVYLMSMSLTTEPSNDGPAVTEGLIYNYFFFSLINFSVLLVLVQSGVCHKVYVDSDIIRL